MCASRATCPDRRDYRHCRYKAYDNAWADLEPQDGGPIGQGRVITRDVPGYYED